MDLFSSSSVLKLTIVKISSIHFQPLLSSKTTNKSKKMHFKIIEVLGLIAIVLLVGVSSISVVKGKNCTEVMTEYSQKLSTI